jgi:hypothetical protein
MVTGAYASRESGFMGDYSLKRNLRYMAMALYRPERSWYLISPTRWNSLTDRQT